ncbi:LLM class flavin-dependent oxidoreductase [Miltoncostaea marina]|uniref:LLM class flavin-dependent oxidoreductase n=1 Tax=Miltoncostaea marina TaxID=2843215 RepID=UPI001C3E0FEF|nr:LLM class flavin-dependent oxidoreductase [Miltoncostaea marina]
MSEPARLELSAMGAVRPPASAALEAAARRERQGFDAVWWADHLLHWFPTSIWAPDLVPQAAAGQASPHVWFDPFAVVAAAAGATERVRLGIGVTDVVRRHPVALAQTALTLDHLTGGRFLLGVGAGEALNLAPIGVANRRPLGRLEEALEVMRLLWASPDPVDFRGDHFTLDGAALGLRPVGDRPPPVWLAAHRPRGLALAGRHADGWLPLATDPDEYAGMLAAVRAAAAAAGRPGDAVTAGLYARIVVAESRTQAVAAIDRSLLLRFIALTRPAEAFARHGAEHPLGEGAFGLTSFLPTRLGREEALRLAGAVPVEVLRDTVIHGTPDDVAGAIAAFVDRGARHVQLTNMTPLADPSMAATSEALLADAVVAVRAATSA